MSVLEPVMAVPSISLTSASLQANEISQRNDGKLEINRIDGIPLTGSPGGFRTVSEADWFWPM